MQHPLDSHRAIQHSKESYIAVKRRYTQTGAQERIANAFTYFDQLDDKASCIRPVVLGKVVAVSDRLWRDFGEKVTAAIKTSACRWF